MSDRGNVSCDLGQLALFELLIFRCEHILNFSTNMIFQNLVCGTPQDNLHELNIIPGKHIFTYSTYVFRHTVISWNIVIRFDSGVLILVFNPLFPHKSKTEGRKDCRLIFVTHPKKNPPQPKINQNENIYIQYVSESIISFRWEPC